MDVTMLSETAIGKCVSEAVRYGNPEDNPENGEDAPSVAVAVAEEERPSGRRPVPSLLRLAMLAVTSELEGFPPGSLGALSESHWEGVIRCRVALQGGGRRGNRPHNLPTVSEKDLVAIEHHPNNVHLSESKKKGGIHLDGENYTEDDDDNEMEKKLKSDSPFDEEETPDGIPLETAIGKCVSETIRVLKKLMRHIERGDRSDGDMEELLWGYPRFLKPVDWGQDGHFDVRNSLALSADCPRSKGGAEEPPVTPLVLLQQILQDWKDMASENYTKTEWTSKDMADRYDEMSGRTLDDGDADKDDVDVDKDTIVICCPLRESFEFGGEEWTSKDMADRYNEMSGGTLNDVDTDKDDVDVDEDTIVVCCPPPTWTSSSRCAVAIGAFPPLAWGGGAGRRGTIDVGRRSSTAQSPRARDAMMGGGNDRRRGGDVKQGEESQQQYKGIQGHVGPCHVVGRLVSTGGIISFAACYHLTMGTCVIMQEVCLHCCHH
ncbi:hypothetical protein ACHAW5_011067 [Stephanodiscus triporus]|uniref:Rab3 GTPase-activating protein catalytic subunit n=1 Tax=Stephanodiscus triporus TaxID=2934178 RepID=A0ABD3QXG0_9STRA